MKQILLACHHSNIDLALQDALLQLARANQVDLVDEETHIFERLMTGYDLLVIDSQFTDDHGLALIEGIAYIDTTMPIIVLLPELDDIPVSAYPRRVRLLRRPFELHNVLRTVDRLLFQQFNRYRTLATALTDRLTEACTQLGARGGFLLDDHSNCLAATSTLTDTQIAKLTQRVHDCLDDPQSATVPQHPHQTVTSGIYVTELFEHLHLVLLLGPGTKFPRVQRLIEDAALDLIVDFNRYLHDTFGNTMSIKNEHYYAAAGTALEPTQGDVMDEMTVAQRLEDYCLLKEPHPLPSLA